MKHLIQPLAWGVTLASILAAASALALSLATPMAA
ncbi:MAG TPA: DnrO protein, partial [Pseudomonas sp.]|nr:DnrO protein [Pseudomonas sp.]